MTRPHQFDNHFVKERLLQDFYFFNVGHEVCWPNHSFGPTVKENYLLHFVSQGQGRFQVDGLTLNLTAPSFFLIRPGERIFYQADDTDPWEYYWLGFDGTQAENLLTTAALTNDVHSGQVIAPETVVTLFEKLLALDLYQPANKFKAQSLFYGIFSHFESSHTPTVTSGNSWRQTYQDSFLLYVANHYSRSDLTISEISHSVGLNRTYFSQLMTKLLGRSPQAYLKKLRLEKAADLLLTTDLSIAEIALQVGYTSSQSLSRAFKDYFGCTPSRYGKNT